MVRVLSILSLEQLLCRDVDIWPFDFEKDVARRSVITKCNRMQTDCCEKNGMCVSMTIYII